MNKLKSLYKLLKTPKNQVEEYCRNKRYERYDENGAYITHLRVRSIIHYFLVIVLKFQRIFKRQKIKIVNNKSLVSGRPIIYAGTHIGGDDIETAFETIITPCWLLLGDPREIYRNVAGLMLDLNGVICFDTSHQKDRRIAKERCIALLKKGGNLLMFPEGAWNISENQLIMHLFPGAVDIAKECCADIVPVAIARNDKTYYVNIGENIAFYNNEKDRYVCTLELRNTLATLKWEIIEQIAPLKRGEFSPDYSINFLNDIMGVQIATYTVQDVLDTKFHPKDQTEHVDAFLHLNTVYPTMQNAFLFNKRWKG